MLIKSLVAIPTLAVGSLLYIRKKTSKKWMDISKYSDTVAQNLDGKAFLITGGNTGLGYHVAMDLARRQGTVVIACRNVEKGKKAIAEITEKTGNENVECLPLDLGDLKSVESFSTLFIEKYPKVYAVICNAGVWIPMEKKAKTTDKFEAHFGINHLGHFALLKSLIPHLKESGMKSRVIIVSSGLSLSGKIDMEKQDFVYEGRKTEMDQGGRIPSGYSDSKLMNALTCKYLAKSYSDTKDSNISFYALCPGWCNSGLSRDIEMSYFAKKIAGVAASLFQRSPEQGAQNILYTTLEDNGILENGGFYRDGKIAEKESEFIETLLQDETDRKLWELSEKLLTDNKD